MLLPSASTSPAVPVILSATSTSKLSEDYISTQNILLDLTNNNPIAVFQDSNGDTENDSWTTPTSLPLCSNLQTTNSPDTGALIISGVTQEGNLQFVQQADDGTWIATTIDFNSETHFGLWQAIGTSSNQAQYTLTGVQEKVAIAL